MAVKPGLVLIERLTTQPWMANVIVAKPVYSKSPLAVSPF